jgi:hypothetical protein
MEIFCNNGGYLFGTDARTQSGTGPYLVCLPQCA